MSGDQTNFPTNKNMKKCPVIFKNESIEFVKECCLLGFKISTDVLNRNIDNIYIINL